MLSFEPSIAFVDDKIDEVEGIIKRYREQGAGCIYFNSHLTDGDNPPQKCYSDVSLIFLDIYFSSNFYDYNPEFCAGWVASLIPERTFYTLVIWTTDKSKADEVLTELEKKKRTPFCYLVKWKEQYRIPEGFDVDKLKQDIEEELKKTPAISEIGIWKRNIKSASNKVIGGLTKVSDPEIVNKKLQKIIVGHGGTSIIKEDEYRKRDVLFDALNQVLASNASDIKNLPEIDGNSIDLLYKNLSPKNKQDVDKELNSWFHFKLNEPSGEIIVPGLVSKMKNKLIKKLYSISDDEKLSKKLVNQSPQNGVQVEDIVVVITRPCDIAQKKSGKNVKLLSGLKIIKPYRYTADNIGKKDKEKYLGRIDFIDLDLPDSCKLYDHLFLSEEEPDVAFLFDFRYVFSVPERIFISKFRNIKIFNKELLSEIQVEYASYSSRLGITQII